MKVRFLSKIVAVGLGASILLASMIGVQAQTYPDRPITLVVPFPPGGSTDSIGRLLAEVMGPSLGQQIVIENKGGASGNIGGTAVAKADPDGYTLLLVTTGPAAVNKLLFKNLAFDPSVDFAPIGLVGRVPQVVIVSEKLPVDDIASLIAYIKANPGTVNVGNSGVGTMAHIIASSFALQNDLDVRHIAYRGSAPLITDITGGQIEVAFPGFTPQLANNKVLAVSGEQRVAALPDVPTLTESGVDLVAGTWFGLVGPAGMPAEMVEKVNSALRAFLEDPAAAEKLESVGVQPMGGTPEEMGAFMAAETERWRPVIEANGISLE